MSASILDELVTLHAEVDQQCHVITASYADNLKCSPSCCDCCRSDLTVFEVEALRIRTHCGGLLASEAPHPPGGCAFLSAQGLCRIYEHRPYVCRTQGLPLRWIEEGVEYRDICPLNAPAVDPVTLSAAQCWEIGPVEARLRELQARLQAGEAEGAPLRRVELRSLFGGGGPARA